MLSWKLAVWDLWCNMDTSHDITQILSFRQTIVTSPSPTHRFKNVIFEISPSEAVGVFDVKAKFMGVHLETLQLEYQVYMWMMYSDAGMWKRWSNGILWLIFLSFLKYFFKWFLLPFSISPHLPRSPLSLLLFLPLVLSLPLHLISLTHLLLSLLFSLPGPPAAAVWGCGCDEALRQGHHQCQPAHLPAQQEVLREIDGWDGEMDGKRRRGGYRHCWEQNI